MEELHTLVKALELPDRLEAVRDAPGIRNDSWNWQAGPVGSPQPSPGVSGKPAPPERVSSPERSGPIDPGQWGASLGGRVHTVGTCMRPKIIPMLFFLALSAAPATGQVRVVGRVIDDLTEHPLSLTHVSLRAPDGSLIGERESTETGTFEFQVRGVGAIRLTVERYGYQANTTPLLYFDARKFFQVEIRMDPEAILLAPLEVIAWSARPENALHEAFKRRVETGMGVYITRDQVEARKPLLVTDLLREIPGLEFETSGYGNRPSVRMIRAAGMRCSTQIFVDGFLVNRRVFTPGSFEAADVSIDDYVSPGSVEGIEVYRGLSTVPPEFLNPDADCGVIAIWTRRGG